MQAPVPSSNYKSIALIGYGVILGCVGGAGAWAALAQLDSAVVAHASVALESRRQVVQHLEGGIIKDIKVKEGALVHEGDVLFLLEDTQTRSGLDLVQNQLDAARAQEARLLAERDRAPAIEFPPDLKERAGDKTVRGILDDQVSTFEQRKASLEGQISILRSRQASFRDEIEGLKVEKASAAEQVFFIKDELSGVRDLADRGLIAKTRRNSLEREKARLDGVLGRNDIDVAKALGNINEMELQIRGQEQKVQEDIATALHDTRQKVSEFSEKRRVALDAVRRNELVAPRSGIVQNLKVTTIGQVLRPGDVVLEIAPVNVELIVEAQVQPTDIDSIVQGMTAEVRFPSFHSRTTPLVLGVVNTVSHDRLIDDTTHQPYFLAQIAVSDTDIPEAMKGRLRAGMPADVVFSTGERTALEYMIQPLREAMRQTFREK